MDKPVFLIGYMGSGKTTLAKKLANKLQCPFVDMDDLIVEKIGMPITDFFAEHGEDEFRKVEQSVLHSLANEKAIISTGGGAPCFFDNMQWINEHGFSVYLYMTPKALHDRLLQSKLWKRPILMNKSPEELRIFIEEKLQEREPFYRKANLIIDQINTSVDDLIKLLQHPHLPKEYDQN